LEYSLDIPVANSSVPETAPLVYCGFPQVQPVDFHRYPAEAARLLKEKPAAGGRTIGE